MAGPDAARDQALKEISGSLKSAVKLLETMNTNAVDMFKKLQQEQAVPPKPPYTAKHIPYLDRLHGDIDLGDWWQRSEERQRILNTDDA